jgi:hypothetical protein
VQGASGTGMTCTLTTTSVDCSLDDLPASTTRTLRLTLRGDTVGTGHIALNVSADNDPTTGNNTGAGTLNVQSSVQTVTNPGSNNSTTTSTKSPIETSTAGGGGGGSSDLLYLVALLGVLGLKRRAR